MYTVGSLVYSDSADYHNRFAQVLADASIDKDWTINVTGTDNNGDLVIPHFITIDNYNNSSPVNYSIDNFDSSIAAYTSVILEIAPHTTQIVLNLISGTTNIFISEQKPPLTEGQKYTTGSNAPVTGTQFMFITAGSTFNVPANWNSANNAVHCIGCGSAGLAGSGAGNASDGGGAGGYSRYNNLALTPGAIENCQIGAANSGVDTWVKNATTVRANGAGPNTTPGASLGVGTVRLSGLNGGKGQGGVGGGGAGAPGLSQGTGGGNTGIGGNGGGTGGGIGGAVNVIGQPGSTWTQTAPVITAGPGGGGGGSNVAGTAGKAAGNYGAGGGGGVGAGGAGGAGAPGLIVLEWTP